MTADRTEERDDAEVDDLLAWLQERSEAIVVAWTDHDESDSEQMWACSVYLGGERGVIDTFRASPRSAVVAAVRQVASDAE